MEALRTLAEKVIKYRFPDQDSRAYLGNQDEITLSSGFMVSEDINIGNDMTVELTMRADEICDDMQNIAKIYEQNHPERVCVVVLFQSDYDFDPKSRDHRYTFKFKFLFN